MKHLFKEEFEQKLKKYPTNEIAKIFSNFGINYYDKSNDEKPLEKEFIINKFQKQKIYIMPWLFPDIIYFSTFNNDYRSNKLTDKDAWDLYGRYQNYFINMEDEHVGDFANKKNLLTLVMYGTAQQQFIYQKSYTYINRFSRSYYLLKDVVIDNVSLDSIVREKLSISLENYIDNLILITVLSMHNAVLNSEQILNVINDIDTYLSVAKYLSVDYDECRHSNLNKDIFKVKPILLTQHGEYISTSFYLMLYNLGDNLYWLFKDKYKNKNNFIVKFGEIFESYVYEILKKKLGNIVFRIPRERNEKSADFYFESNNFSFIVEVKSGVAKLDSKTTILNEKSFNDFIKNNVLDALEQIDSSAKIYNKKHIIPIIINYDLLYVEDVILNGIDELYQSKNYNINEIILLGIDELENLLFSITDIESLDKIVTSTLKKGDVFGLQIYKLLETTVQHKDYFYKNKFDINRRLLKSLS